MAKFRLDKCCGCGGCGNGCYGSSSRQTQLEVYDEPVVINSANIGIFEVTQDNAKHYHILVDTTLGDVTISNQTYGQYLSGAILTFQKVTTDSNKLLYNDGYVTHQFLQNQGDTVSLKWTDNAKYFII